MKDNEVEKELKDRFRGIANQSPFLDENEKITDECLYEHSSSFSDPIGLKMAHIKKTLAVSLLTNTQWNTVAVQIAMLCNNEALIQIEVRHLANPIHFLQFKRAFEFNPKHGKGGKGEQRGQSKIYSCTIEEAEILLNTAIEHPNKSRWYCNYDERNERFIVFLPHDSEHNKYHGFHYENQPNSDPDRDLNNPQNGIPKNTQEFLKSRT